MDMAHHLPFHMQAVASSNIGPSPSYASSHIDSMLPMLNYVAPSSILTHLLNRRFHHPSYDNTYDHNTLERMSATSEDLWQSVRPVTSDNLWQWDRQRSYYELTHLPFAHHEPLRTLNHRSMSQFQNNIPNLLSISQNTASVPQTTMERFIAESYPNHLGESVEGSIHTEQSLPLPSDNSISPHNKRGIQNHGSDTQTSNPSKKRKESNESTSPYSARQDVNQYSPGKNAINTPPKSEKKCPTTTIDVQNNNNVIAFDMIPSPIKLYNALDEKNLTQLQCFIRNVCIDVFTVAKDDVHDYLTGKGNVICVGQVGIRCSFCRLEPPSSEIRGSIYFPRSVELIYGAAMNLIQRHFFSCPLIPADVRGQYCELKQVDARSGASRVYWTQSAINLGLFDTTEGIRYCAANVVTAHAPRICSDDDSNNDASRRNTTSLQGHLKTDDSDVSSYATDSNTFLNNNAIGSTNGNMQNQMVGEGGASSASSASPTTDNEYVCWPEDEENTTRFTYFLMRQMSICSFTEGDRLGKRKELPLNFGGIACRHCISDFGTGRFFPSSIKTMSDTTKTLNILHTHILKCRKCPATVKDELNELRKTHENERATLRFGSQKAFFSKVWSRVHPSSTLT